MVVAGTLALVSTALLAYFWIRDRLASDPDLQEFMQRVEEGRAAEERADAAGTDEAEDDSSA